MRPIPDFNQPAPLELRDSFDILVIGLNHQIPDRTGQNLLMASWNIKVLSSLR